MRTYVMVTVVLLALAVPSTLLAQAADSTQAQQSMGSTSDSGSSFMDNIYYGGNVTLSFGAATRIGIWPLVAYKVIPELSLGLQGGYEYVNYDNTSRGAHNYGGAVFGRYRIVPQLYAHAEYQLVSYQLFDLDGASRRDTIPFFLVGGGYSQRIAPRTWAYGEVLFDILRDDQSPYDAGEPILRFGVGVGF